MSYCLLLQGVDGSLRLVAEAPFASRNEALTALAREAESGGVDSASDQVWLIDLDSVAPVVLVARPAAPETPAQAEAEADAPTALDAVAVEEPEPVVTEPRTVVPVEPAWAAAAGVTAGVTIADVVEDDDTAPEAVEAAETDETAADDTAVEVTEAADDTEAPDLATEESPDAAEPEAGEPEPSELRAADEMETTAEVDSPDEPAIAEQSLTSVFDLNASASEEPVSEPASANHELEPEAVAESTGNLEAAPEPTPAAGSILEDLVVPEPEPELELPGDDSFSDLREALERSAAQMAAEGIVVPSAPVLEPVEEPSENPSEELAPEASVVAGDSVAEEPVAVKESALEEPATPEESAVAEEPEPPSPTPAAPVEWPWAATLPTVEESESELETEGATSDATEAEPSDDQQEGAPAEAPSEVVMGEIDAEPSEPMSVTSGEDTDITFAGSGEDYVNLPEPQQQTAADQVQEAETSEESVLPAPSAYNAEVESVITPTAASTPGYTPASQGVGDMTCGDCVWVDTCPNKDQRDPASCGSFQWK